MDYLTAKAGLFLLTTVIVIGTVGAVALVGL